MDANQILSILSVCVFLYFFSPKCLCLVKAIKYHWELLLIFTQSWRVKGGKRKREWVSGRKRERERERLSSKAERAKWTRLYKIKKQIRGDNLCRVIASNYSPALLEGRWGRGLFQLKRRLLFIPDQLLQPFSLLFLDINLRKKKKKSAFRCYMFTPVNPPLGRQWEFKLPIGSFYSPENQFVHKE